MNPANGSRRRGPQIAKWGCLVLVSLILAGAVYQVLGEASDRRAFPPTGELHDVDGFVMHLHCMGEGSPTVILDAGNGGMTSTWAWIQPRLATHTRVCSYDRAGLGWSDERPGPRDAETVARQIGSLLEAAEEPGPYLHVGHSMGGLYGRAFAARYPAEVVGLVLVDASHPEQFDRLSEALARRMTTYLKLMRLAPWAARVGLVRATNFFGQMAQGLPPEEYARAAATSASVRSVRASIAEMDAWETNAAQLAAAPPLEDLPLAVVTAGEAPGMPEAFIEAHHANQRELANLSSRARHEIVPGANHLSLLMDEAHALVTSQAILDLLASVRGIEARVAITDLSSGFMAFYEAATATAADEEQRWRLWKEHYGFAALPPVPERDSLARSMLEDAWPRYSDVLDRIEAGADGLVSPQPLLQSVALLLGAEAPLEVELLAYVGALEGNAFFAPQPDGLLVAVPLEGAPDRQARSLVHEFTHAAHHAVAGRSGGWERSIGLTVFSEGLANHATARLLPGERPHVYLGGRDGWFEEAEAMGEEILRGILPHLGESDSDQVMRFTMGRGTTGIEREAYYVGWVVVGHLLKNGHPFAELARVPEAEVPALVEQAIQEVIDA